MEQQLLFEGRVVFEFTPIKPASSVTAEEVVLLKSHRQVVCCGWLKALVEGQSSQILEGESHLPVQCSSFQLSFLTPSLLIRLAVTDSLAYLHAVVI